MMRFHFGVILSLALGAAAFIPSQQRHPSFRQVHSNVDTRAAWVSKQDNGFRLFAKDEKKKGKSEGVDAAMRSKLLTESIAPWRTIRVFLYASLGSGAFIGGLVTLSGVAVKLSNPEVDMNVEYLNLAIDFGAAAAFAIFAKLDLDKGSELTGNVEQKIERKKEQKKVVKAMREREELLQGLNLDIQVSSDGSTQEASVKNVQLGARQHMIIVAGPRKACKNALIGANLLKMDFAMSNVLVVPYETDISDGEVRPSGGFGDRPAYETQPYVAGTVGPGWSEYIKAEMDDAVKQNGEKVKEEGIAVVIACTGKVLRRGVGKVPWRQMVEQLEDEVRIVPKDEPTMEIPFLSE